MQGVLEKARGKKKKSVGIKCQKTDGAQIGEKKVGQFTHIGRCGGNGEGTGGGGGGKVS